MNILIENTNTLEYLTGTGSWTKNPVEGKAFKATGVALRFARQEPIGKFNVVFYIPQTRQFVNLGHGHGKGEGASVEA